MGVTSDWPSSNGRLLCQCCVMSTAYTQVIAQLVNKNMLRRVQLYVHADKRQAGHVEACSCNAAGLVVRDAISNRS